MRKTPLEKQWDKLIRQESSFLEKSSQKKPSRMEEILADKVPEKLQSTLHAAFVKSFLVIFENGIPIIEKSYRKDEIEMQQKINAYAFSIKQDKKRTMAFEKTATKSELVNVLIAGTKGVGLGLLGIGLPDIPIFIGMVLRGIYEIALQYGYDYTSEEEQYFILTLISTALSYGPPAIDGNAKLDTFIETQALPVEYDKKLQIHAVASVLSTELLCMKFVQGLPLVGIVGGLADAVFTKRILAYAAIKYKRRFLYAHMQK